MVKWRARFLGENGAAKSTISTCFRGPQAGRRRDLMMNTGSLLSVRSRRTNAGKIQRDSGQDASRFPTSLSPPRRCSPGTLPKKKTVRLHQIGQCARTPTTGECAPTVGLSIDVRSLGWPVLSVRESSQHGGNRAGFGLASPPHRRIWMSRTALVCAQGGRALGEIIQQLSDTCRLALRQSRLRADGPCVATPSPSLRMTTAISSDAEKTIDVPDA